MLKVEDIWSRSEPLSSTEDGLLRAVFKAHAESCFRPSVSSAAVANAAAGSGDIGKAIVAGILTLGGKHAPLEQTYHFLELASPNERVEAMLKADLKIPGWGGTFQKDGPDPIWRPVDQLLHESWPTMAVRLDSVTEMLQRRGKLIHPNPSAYTAATAIVLGFPAKLAVYLFIAARIDAWARIGLSQIGKES